MYYVKRRSLNLHKIILFSICTIIYYIGLNLVFSIHYIELGINFLILLLIISSTVLAKKIINKENTYFKSII